MAGTRRALLATWMVGVLLGLAWEATAAPREQIRLRIVGPPDGTVLAPGQTFVVEVEALPRRRVNAVALLSPLVGDLKERPPFVFTLTIPPDAPLGPLSLTALARGQSNEIIEAATTIHIETATAVESIQVTTPRLFLATQRRISVSGTFADGIRREITRSREIRYTSSNPQVATASPEGLIEASTA